MISFTVRGNPVAQGSMVAFMPKNGLRPILHASNDNELMKWRREIGKAANLAMRDTFPAGKEVPIRVRACFFISRYVGGDEFSGKKWKAKYCTVFPDVDKLARALLDGLKGICFDDDKQVTELCASKDFSEEPRVEVVVEEVSVEQEMLRLVPVHEDQLPF